MRLASDRVLLFDLGGVLLPFDRERRVRAMSGALGVEPDPVRSLVASGIAKRLDLGLADDEELAVEMSRLGSRATSAAQARRLWLSAFETPNLALWQTMARLRDTTPVGFLSDNPASVRDVFPDRDAFDHEFLSAELGMLKPSPEIFAAVQALLDIPPLGIVFIDDMPANVAAARVAGWDALVYSSNEQLAADLADRGLS
jgi:HAD superfamily hydrolase (TIGR01509 family)